MMISLVVLIEHRLVKSVFVNNSNNVEATFDFVERIVRLVAFDNVTSTLLLVWMGFNGRSDTEP